MRNQRERNCVTVQGESLLDPNYMGGLDASKGYRFETTYILSRIQSWLSSSDLKSFQQETWSDVELFFASGARQLIQIKDHALRPSELVEILAQFRKREQAFRYEQFTIASAGLAPSIEKLNRQLKRYRNLEAHNEVERAAVARIIQETLDKLHVGDNPALVLEKLFFDSNVASLKDSEFCRNAFLGAMVFSYRISIDSAEKIFLQTAEVLNRRHGELIELSLFREALIQTQLEDQEVLLSTFRLISKRFLESIQKDSQVTFFYVGAAPTWSDIVNDHDVSRDITAPVTLLINEWENGKLFVPIVAEAGEGKSTLLRRMAAGLATQNKPVLYHDTSATSADYKEVQRIAGIAQQCVYVFFDEAAKIQNLQGFLQSISELPITVVMIAAARPYEMKAVRAAYTANIQVAFDPKGSEYSIEGLSDREIELLVHHLLKMNLLCLPPGVGASVAAEAIKKRTDRKFLVLALELTQGGRVQDIVRDEIERIRHKNERLLSIYRYVCLMASIDSFITVPMVEELTGSRNVKLDVASELPGLVTIEEERLYPRHNRIGEIATELFFQNQDNERGDMLCKIISVAFTRGELDVIKSAIRISHSVPESQIIRVVNHLIDEAFFFGEVALIQNFIEEFEWASKRTELFLEFLTAKTPFLWRHLIFPNGPNLDWRGIEQAHDLSLQAALRTQPASKRSRVTESFDGIMKWAQIFGLAAWHIREQTPFLVAITSKIYQILEERYPDRKFDVSFAHAEFLCQSWKRKEAIPLYECVLSQHPNYADAHAGLALALYATEDYSLALDHFKAALRIDPQSLFRVADESLFEEMTERVLELEEYLEYKKALVRRDFRMGRGFQNIIAKDPTILVNLQKRDPEEVNRGFGFYNRMDYGEQAEERQIEELNRLLEYLPSATAEERRHLENMISESFGKLRDAINEKNARTDNAE
jgi:tetratricopeptide (TPR) repeat protein